MSNRNERTIENRHEAVEENQDQIGNVEPPPPYTPVDTLYGRVITNQPVIHQTIIVQQSLKDEPVLIDCPSCHKRSMTNVVFANSQKTHMIAGFICGLTMWCMLCCLAALPYTLKTFKKPEHYCSHCNYYLGPASKF
ncbi:lipopolysaccharide-induced tumor necrosis factor-alpha factor homolog [Zerene cesonia]|uniref:lipopolysaccharide-induced tumor necrosis factor-alpha factor homolog n=1 Tax=Zerene cesonia TaxID=33412 RepID=UPI0018E4F9E1|nr:lipopolysaccharide-induced tumor necrosis factor-alpha factor homolog [Zerene cesonia]